jgi:hypothetical protein
VKLEPVSIRIAKISLLIGRGRGYFGAFSVNSLSSLDVNRHLPPVVVVENSVATFLRRRKRKTAGAVSRAHRVVGRVRSISVHEPLNVDTIPGIFGLTFDAHLTARHLICVWHPHTGKSKQTIGFPGMMMLLLSGVEVSAFKSPVIPRRMTCCRQMSCYQAVSYSFRRGTGCNAGDRC